MFCLIVLLILIIIIFAFLYYNNVVEYFYPYTVSTRHTKNMSYDLRGDIPPFYTFTGPWLQSDIYNPVYTRYTQFQDDQNNFDNGYQYIRPNGTLLYL